MRLAAQAKMGFYPAPNEAIKELSKHLFKGPAGDRCHHFIEDPCAGKGEAIATLADCLEVPYANVYAIELDEARGNAVKERMPDANILTPCSFFTAYMPAWSYGLVYCNPPFDDELGGGGREELSFLRECQRLLVDKGVIVFVCPWKTMQHRDVINHLDSNYDDGRVYRFPEMEYRECVFIGVKRKSMVTENKLYYRYLNHDMRLAFYDSRYSLPDDLTPLGQPDALWQDGVKVGVEAEIKRWEIPACWRPHSFKKTGYVPGELEEELKKSPLNDLILDAPEVPLQRPPLPLGSGHVGLQLASGAINGLLVLPDGLTHVNKGIPSKEEYLNEDACEEKLSEDGEHVHVKTVYSQQITLQVRAVGLDGVIYTFSSSSLKGQDQRTETKTLTKEQHQQFLIEKVKKLKHGETLTVNRGTATLKVS